MSSVQRGLPSTNPTRRDTAHRQRILDLHQWIFIHVNAVVHLSVVLITEGKTSGDSPGSVTKVIVTGKFDETDHQLEV